MLKIKEYVMQMVIHENSLGRDKELSLKLNKNKFYPLLTCKSNIPYSTKNCISDNSSTIPEEIFIRKEKASLKCNWW